MFNLFKNIDVSNIFLNPVTQIIISIIWGLGLATLFQRACKSRDCIIMKGPSPSKIKDKVFKYNDKCYVYNTELSKCEANHKIYNISA